MDFQPRNPRWADPDHTSVIVDVTLQDGSEATMAVRESTLDSHIHDIYVLALSGELGPIAEFVEELPPVPQSISFAQLLIGLVHTGLITQEEGEQWLAGTLPATVQGIISTLPPELQFGAKVRALRPSTVERNDPLVNALGAYQGLSATELDEFFWTASKA